MVSYAHLLARRYKGRFDGDADDFIGFIVESSVRMKSLIQDLLRYSLIDRSDPPAAPADTEICLQTAVTELSATIKTTGARIEMPARAPHLPGDAHQITELFRCVLGNALEYRSPHRSPVIRIDIHSVGSFWEFAVSDNGIGIESQYFDRIFLVFERLHTQRTHPGTGVGLAIAKKIVERHGGHISVSSETGEGSTFRFTLPAVAAVDPISPTNLVEAEAVE